MSEETKIEPKSLGMPSVDQCKAVYRSMLDPTIKQFHAKMLELGFKIGHATCGRFVKKHIKKEPRRTKDRAPALVGSSLSPEALAQLIVELKASDMSALKERREKERLIYDIVMLVCSQYKADILSIMPKESAAMVKSMSQAPAGAAAAMPTAAGEGMNGYAPPEQNEVSNAISLFLVKEGVAA